jgi:hypothetical protein
MEKDKYKQLWKLNCAQLQDFDHSMSQKEEDLEQLRLKLRQMEQQTISVAEEPSAMVHRGRAPLVDFFNGEDGETALDDWLPSQLRGMDGLIKS